MSMTKRLSTKVDGEAGVPLPHFLNLASFDNFFRYYHQRVVEEVHTNVSYSGAEVQKLKEAFDAYDKDKSGAIGRDELVKLLGTYFPDAVKSKQQQELQTMVNEVDDGDGELTFKEFL